jgi:SAM-dependent methyltransferase
MKSFEWSYLCCTPFLPPLYRFVQQRLRKIVRGSAQRLEVLDVGGRKSHYTIGLPANITVTDLPRVSPVQQQLHLGVTSDMATQLQQRRSNIRALLYDDMTCSQLPDESYDVIVAVEVLEHVAEDELFVQQVCRVLKPGGVFLMTTPNGRYVPNHNPDHKRHYQPEQLQALLERNFKRADVTGIVANSVFGAWGLYSWSARRPMRTLQSMFGNLVNHCLSIPLIAVQRPEGTCHLIAQAVKPMESSSLEEEVFLTSIDSLRAVS